MNWVDYLVLAATILAFLAVVAAHNPHNARAQDTAALISSSQWPDHAGRAPVDPALIGARIKLATGQL
ncbi:MAG: hypothetical protein JSR91_19040 [Proteobacteria bacterium]|nr:hypothetical protein [Pseudomonadota bacterium]